jgi:accessory gene regulator protein AgrB
MKIIFCAVNREHGGGNGLFVCLFVTTLALMSVAYFNPEMKQTLRVSVNYVFVRVQC